ncbi:MAG: hypothetical protein DLM54_04215 [Acidimicrobiales bacterium]|nr:MAG: hypothetical protein DLM54_04215 [Acidimicrobiales bacterium]
MTPAVSPVGGSPDRDCLERDDRALASPSSPTRTIGLAAIRSTLPLLVSSWVAARVLTFLALAAVVQLGVAQSSHPTLNIWDADNYQRIAGQGYSAALIRFFPLFPLVIRAVRWVLPLSPPGAALLIANVAALGYAAALWLLIRSHVEPTLTGTNGIAGSAGIVASEGIAGSAVWLTVLAPTGFVLVLGYSEALFGLLAVLVFILLHRRHFAWAALFGLLAGLARPVGLLLAVPAAVEALQAWRSARFSGKAWSVLPVLAPIGGCAAYLGWVASAYGNPLLPFTDQVYGPRASFLADPLTPLHHSLVALIHGTDPVSILHLPVALLFVALLVISARRLPWSYTAFGAVMLVAALTARTLDSLERYCYSDFPLVIALALCTRRRTAILLAVGISAGLLVFYAVLTLTGHYTP